MVGKSKLYGLMDEAKKICLPKCRLMLQSPLRTFFPQTGQVTQSESGIFDTHSPSPTPSPERNPPRSSKGTTFPLSSVPRFRQLCQKHGPSNGFHQLISERPIESGEIVRKKRKNETKRNAREAGMRESVAGTASTWRGEAEERRERRLGRNRRRFPIRRTTLSLPVSIEKLGGFVISRRLPNDSFPAAVILVSPPPLLLASRSSEQLAEDGMATLAATPSRIAGFNEMGIYIGWTRMIPPF